MKSSAKVKRMSIGEFSTLSGISVKALRHWDEMGLLTPAYVDQSSRYRYYLLQQLQVVDRLEHLKTMGLPMNSLMHWAAEEGLEEGDKLTAEQFQHYAERKLEEKARDIHRAQLVLKWAKRCLAEERYLEQHVQAQGIRPSERYFINYLCSVERLSQIPDDYALQTALSEFYAELKKLNAPMAADWGMLLFYNSDAKHWDIFPFISLLADESFPFEEKKLKEEIELYDFPARRFRSWLCPEKDTLQEVIKKCLTPNLLTPPYTMYLIHMCSQISMEKESLRWQVELPVECPEDTLSPKEVIFEDFQENLKA